jgi:hypothetical protein
VFEDMEEELKMFDAVVPSFSDLLLRVKEKFDVAFTLKGRFDSGKIRAHFILMPLRNKGHWSHYTRVIQGSIVTMAEVVVENGYRKEDMEDKLSFDGIGGDEHQWGSMWMQRTPGNMDLGGQSTQEQLHSSPMVVNEPRWMLVGHINNDFNVGSYE